MSNVKEKIISNLVINIIPLLISFLSYPIILQKLGLNQYSQIIICSLAAEFINVTVCLGVENILIIRYGKNISYVLNVILIKIISTLIISTLIIFLVYLYAPNIIATIILYLILSLIISANINFLYQATQKVIYLSYIKCISAVIYFLIIIVNYQNIHVNLIPAALIISEMISLVCAIYFFKKSHAIILKTKVNRLRKYMKLFYPYSINKIIWFSYTRIYYLIIKMLYSNEELVSYDLIQKFMGLSMYYNSAFITSNIIYNRDIKYVITRSIMHITALIPILILSLFLYNYYILGNILDIDGFVVIILASSMVFIALSANLGNLILVPQGGRKIYLNSNYVTLILSCLAILIAINSEMKLYYLLLMQLSIYGIEFLFRYFFSIKMTIWSK